MTGTLEIVVFVVCGTAIVAICAYLKYLDSSEITPEDDQSGYKPLGDDIEAPATVAHVSAGPTLAASKRSCDDAELGRRAAEAEETRRAEATAAAERQRLADAEAERRMEAVAAEKAAEAQKLADEAAAAESKRLVDLAAEKKRSADEAAAAEGKRIAEERERLEHRASRTITYYIRQSNHVRRFSQMRSALMDRVRKLRELNVKANKELAGSAEHVELDLGSRKVILKQKILFKSSTPTILEKSYPLCNEIGRVVRTIASVIEKDGADMGLEQIQYVISGHTYRAPGKTGKEAKAIEMSYRRARAVMDFLVESGVNPALLFAHGYGGTRSLGGRPEDERRVEITVPSIARAEYFIKAAEERKAAESSTS